MSWLSLSSENSPKIILPFFLLLIFSTPSAADEKEKLPLWQAGLAFGALSVPHYPGSDQRYSFPLVFPAFVYRGDMVRTTRGGLRGLFYSSENYAIDIGLDGGLPVYSKDNTARKGMPSITWIGEIGPRLVLKLYDDGGGANIHAHLPWRAVGGIDGSRAGWTLGPKLIFTNNNKLPWNLSAVVSLGLKYGSKRYNHLYYGVDEQYQTSSRATYHAKEGVNQALS